MREMKETRRYEGRQLKPATFSTMPLSAGIPYRGISPLSRNMATTARRPTPSSPDEKNSREKKFLKKFIGFKKGIGKKLKKGKGFLQPNYSTTTLPSAGTALPKSPSSAAWRNRAESLAPPCAVANIKRFSVILADNIKHVTRRLVQTR